MKRGYYESLVASILGPISLRELGKVNLFRDTIQTLSAKDALKIPFAISLGWKQRRLFDSRRLNVKSEKHKS